MRAAVVLATALLVTGCMGAMARPPENPAGAGGLTPVTEDPDAGLVGVAGGFELKRYPLFLVDRFTVPASLVKDEEDKKYAALFPGALQSEMVARLRATGLFDRVVNLSETQFSPGDQSALRLEGTITKLDPGSRALRYMVGFGAGAAKAQAETTAAAPSVTSSEASALAGTWRGTLLLSERRGVNPPRNNPARLQIFEDDGGLRWTLESTYYGDGIRGSGTVSVAGNQVKLVGSYTSGLATNRGRSVAIEYTASLDGETLQGLGMGADNVPQRFTLTRAGR